MSIHSTFSEQQKTTTIKVTGNFDFSLHAEFRNCYRQAKMPGMSFCVDLSEAEYMDSSALGMLMLLKEHAEGLGGSVVLQRPSPKIRKLLATVKFEKLFKITD